MATLGPLAPHGPDMDGNHPQYEEMNSFERGAFDKLLRPDDMYTPEGVYWADLPFMKRVSFVWKSENAEAGKELRELGRIFVADPLKPVSLYFSNFVLPGAGLLLEGCVLLAYICGRPNHLTASQLRAVFRLLRPESSRKGLPRLLERLQDLQRELD